MGDDDDSFQLPAFNMLPMPVVDWSLDPKSKQQVQSVEYCSDRLYIGSTEGRVYTYTLNKVSDFEVRGKSEVNDGKADGKSLGFGKKPVSCLIAVPELDRIIVLCNENVTSHSLVDLQLRGPLAKAKGAALICVGCVSGSHYLVTVGKKKKLFVFSLDTTAG